MSGANLAYHLRVNKHIDRCLFLEALGVVSAFRPLREYGYVSMGGNFLEDFRVVHQQFGIGKMYSFDGSANVITRQEMNKPYGFIACAARNSRDVVTGFDALRAEQFGETGNAVVWLDYTTPSERQNQLIDVEILTAKLIAGDVFRVTMNANRSSLGSNEEYQRLHATGETGCTTLWNFRHERLVAALGEQLPPDRNDADHLKNNEAFAATLARAIKWAAQKGINQRQELRLEPLLSVAYSDGQEMITVTVLVLPVTEQEAFNKVPEWEKWKLPKPGADWDQFVEVGVPHLSIRERHAIHSAMNHAGQPNPAHVNFRLDDSEAASANLFEQYRMHYLRYPTFAPLDVV
jgi:hypothetical protein